MGEVVVTALHQFAMPFIRYKENDMAIYEPGQCPCGRSFPRLKEIVGRTNDFLVSADGQFVHGGLFAYLLRVNPDVLRYQVYQPDKGRLQVRLVCTQAVSQDWLAETRAEIQRHFGKSTQVVFRLVDQIELTPAGKHRYIISDVKPTFDNQHGDA
jgi:phenylacetate-CoA ligase